MVAPPPGWGNRKARSWFAGIAAYLLALPVDALVLGSSVYLLTSAFGHLAMWFVGIVALASAVFGSKAGPIRLPEIGWRIPQSWARFGYVTYAALFGAILGVGVLTAVPSIGFYALLAWGLAATDWQAIVPAFAAFGMARVLPLLLAALSAKKRGAYPDKELDGFVELSRVTFTAEVFLLSMVGMILLLQSAAP